MAESHRNTSIRRLAGAIADRIEYIPDAPLSTISEISLGVFLIMAFWSGGSVQAFQRLVNVVARYDADGKLRIVVADADRIPHFYETPPFKGRLHGWGETFWIKDGEILADSGVGLNLDCIEFSTVSLLKMAK